MANAILPYLKEIADALANLEAVGIGGASRGSSGSRASVNVKGTVETEEIDENLRTALVVTVQEEQGGQTVDVEKSVYDVMADDLVDKLHEAFTITVQEEQGGQQVDVEKSALEVIVDDLTQIKATPTNNVTP